MDGTLRISVCVAKDQEDWRAKLSALLPDAAVHAGVEAPPCDYAVVWQPPAGFFARQPQLKAIFSLGAGVNGLLAMPALPPQVPLVRMEDGGMAAQMVEYAMYVALRQFRRFPEYRRSQAGRSWAPQAARPRAGFRVGVLGLGVLGGEAARALADFGFSVTAWSRTPKSVAGVRCECGDEGLRRVLAGSELLLLFLPLTDATRGLIGRETLAWLPEGACIANLSRGELVDENALLAAIDGGRLGEAHLDVFHNEPLPPDHAFWTHPRIHVTPHIAALTDPAIAAEQVAQKIRRLEAGLPVTGVVDRLRQY